LASLILLLAWAGWEARWQPQPEPPPPDLAEQDTPASLAPLTFPAVSDFQATLEQPLFYEDRRLPEAVEPEGSSEPAAEAGSARAARLALTAIIIEDGERSALVSVPGEAASLRLRVGDTAGGWRLIAIGESEITVEADGRQQQIALRDFGAAPMPVPERRAAPRRAPRQVPPDLPLPAPEE
jgi:hypothetical protein